MKSLSCSAAHLYGAGGLYEDRIDAASGAPLFSTLVADVYDPYSYTRELPVHVDAPDPAAVDLLFESYAVQSRTFARGARCAMFALEPAILYDRTLYAVAPPGELVSIYETDREIEQAWKSKLDPALLADCRRPNETDVDYVYFSSVGGENYAHWIVDDLGRTKAILDRYSGGERKVAIVLDKYFATIDEIRCESIQLILGSAVDYEILFIEKKTPHYFDRLRYISPISHTPLLKSPDALRFVVQALCGARDEAAPKRLFVGRNALWRNLMNADEVAQFFADRSFEPVTIDFGSMTFAEQIRLFSNAEVVVGVSGASMVNTIFCPPDARVIYLAGDGFVDPWYWDLACVNRQPYAVSFGEPRDATAPNFSSFSVSQRQLKTIDGWL